MITLPKLILASGSPRRAEILTSVGWEFVKDAADIDETRLPEELPADYVRRLAGEKALAVAGKYPDNVILGADTIVVIGKEIIGKPVDLDDARRMMRLLAGNWHEVLTGIALVRRAGGTSEIYVEVQRTRVKFAAMNDAEIEFLVLRGEPLDKAGGYAVQAQAALFIEKIEGDYWNVVGLPINLLYDLSRKIR